MPQRLQTHATITPAPLGSNNTETNASVAAMAEQMIQNQLLDLTVSGRNAPPLDFGAGPFAKEREIWTAYDRVMELTCRSDQRSTILCHD